MSGEYGLKKDRDRKFFAGEFLWSGIDYIGEPTPYDVYPVKARSSAPWTRPASQGHVLPLQESVDPGAHGPSSSHELDGPRAGQPVAIWAYANVDTVELLLNGQSLGERKFSHKKTLDGRPYLETDEATGDDKTFTTGPFPGSYTSPNGSAGKLHLSWNVPFAPGELVAIAKQNGVEVARDVLRTAGAPSTLRLTPDKTVITADGKSLAFVTVEVVDAQGVMVPSAANLIHFQVTGGALVGADNGRQESAENYKAPSPRTAFNGKVLAIIQSGVTAGPITVTASSDGLTPASTTIVSEGGTGSVASSAVTAAPAGPARHAEATLAADSQVPTADASYSGSPQTVPAAMLDGNKDSGGWSNFYADHRAAARDDEPRSGVRHGLPADLRARGASEPLRIAAVSTQGVEEFDTLSGDIPPRELREQDRAFISESEEPLLAGRRLAMLLHFFREYGQPGSASGIHTHGAGS
ncbi:DUF4982 domain-containing protein [Cystobacter fuscus]